MRGKLAKNPFHTRVLLLHGVMVPLLIEVPCACLYIPDTEDSRAKYMPETSPLWRVPFQALDVLHIEQTRTGNDGMRCLSLGRDTLPQRAPALHRLPHALQMVTIIFTILHI